MTYKHMINLANHQKDKKISNMCRMRIIVRQQEDASTDVVTTRHILRNV